MSIPHIIHEFNLTRDVFDLELEAKIEGEVIYREKANSLTTNFLETLFLSMGLNIPATTSLIQGQRQISEFPESGFQRAISGIITTSPEVILTLPAGAAEIDAGRYVAVMGIRTPAGLNGTWGVTANSNADREVRLTGVTLGLVGTSAYISGNTDSLVIGFYAGPNVTDPFLNDRYFSLPKIKVGASGITTTKTDWCLKNWIMDGAGFGELVHESMILSIPAIAGATSTLTATRDFTNNSGATVVVNEVGLMMKVADPSIYHRTAFMARDLSTFTVPNGATVEVSYRFHTRGVPAGGFLRQFGELFYRQWSGLTREAKDIDNANVTVDEDSQTFRVVGGGGNNLTSSGTNVAAKGGSFIGVQLGSNSTPVDFEDFGLNTRIVHGVTTSQLFYQGSVVHGLITNNTTAQFDITGMFENQSGATIDVYETGLYTGQGDSNLKHYCLARHALAAKFEIPDGQVGKVTYRLSV